LPRTVVPGAVVVVPLSRAGILAPRPLAGLRRLLRGPGGAGPGLDVAAEGGAAPTALPGLGGPGRLRPLVDPVPRRPLGQQRGRLRLRGPGPAGGAGPRPLPGRRERPGSGARGAGVPAVLARQPHAVWAAVRAGGVAGERRHPRL